MTESREGEYDRGHLAGGIDARLANHDKHFAAINGSLGDIAREMHALRLAVQRLGDQAISRDATVITTASALKDAEQARRDTSERSWSPWAKAATVIGALGVLVGLYLALR